MSSRQSWPPSKIAALVVTHNPPQRLQALLQELSRQFDHLVVVDNGSANPITSPDGSSLISNRHNLGLARALNQGCLHLRERGHDWAMLFDQDSMIADGFLSHFERHLATIKQPPAVIGCNYTSTIDGVEKRGSSTPSNGEPVRAVKTVITAGSLCSLPTLAELGGFDEHFFIDHVDNEYCLRARTRGYGVWLITEALFEHQIGEIVLRRFAGRTWESSNHSPLRRYYWCRNLLLTIRRHGWREPGWSLRMLAIELPRNMLALLLLERERGAKLRASLQGLWHGLAGRTGQKA